jgi:signal transduction histidine kinase/PleD family two-component response regulator
MTPDDKIKILLVDDSSSNLVALEAILQAPDREIVRLSSGDDALRYLLQTEVAVILLDVYMPGIDGLQTAELIRSRERSRDIPIIFLTADSTGHRHLSRGYSLGAVDYIVKPVEPEILRSKVAVFVELFKKTLEIKRQADLLYEKNLQLEDTNLARLNMLIELGQRLAAERDPRELLKIFCGAAREIVSAQYAVVGMLNGAGDKMLYFAHSDETKDDKRGDEALQVSARVLNILLTNKRPLRLNESDELLPDAALVSPAVQSFLGAPILSANEGRGWLYLINKLDADGFSEADERLAETMATQVAVAYENARLYADAQGHAAELRLEVAERKQAEEERARLLIREQAARAEAEEANRTKDEFLSTLSHELRTPLTAILGWSHLVRTSSFDEAIMARAFETIERNARSQSQLIDDLLDVSRIITGKLSLNLRPVVLSQVVEAVLDTVRPSFTEKGVHFETDFDPDHTLVSGDTERLQQIFWNLFTNAVKFTPAGGQVTVAVKKKNSHVKVSVSDTGVGIDAEFLPYIFDRFRQADGSTTRQHGGLGLGLAIVRHLVEIHQGSIKVQSPGKGKGTTFQIRLPLALAPVTREAESQAANEKELIAVGDMAHLLDGLRILVVDDEPDSRSLLNAILTGSGSEVRCCASAAGAMQEFEDWNPDLLLSDIGMPDEDGYALIRKLRQEKSKRVCGIPAIALTAYATPDDRAQALAAGFQMHLPKPIEPETLVTSIASAVGRKPPSG